MSERLTAKDSLRRVRGRFVAGRFNILVVIGGSGNGGGGDGRATRRRCVVRAAVGGVAVRTVVSREGCGAPVGGVAATLVERRAQEEPARRAQPHRAAQRHGASLVAFSLSLSLSLSLDRSTDRGAGAL